MMAADRVGRFPRAVSADGAQHPVPCPGLSVDGISVRHIGGHGLCNLADRIVVEPEISRVAGQAKYQALDGFKVGIGGAAITSRSRGKMPHPQEFVSALGAVLDRVRH